MGYSVNIIKLLERVDAPMKEVLIEILAEMERQRMQWEESVTKKEFNELKEIVAELAQLQKMTEQSLGTLCQRVEELAEAQRKTEQRVEELAEAQRKTEQRVEELAEAQRKTEQRVEELAEAQRKTEQRVEELAEAQKKTEERLDSLSKRVEELAEAHKKLEQRVDALTQRVEELAEAQRKTEERLNSLAKKVEELTEAVKQMQMEMRKLALDLKKTREDLGYLSHTVGYLLEDRAYEGLPLLLKRDFGIQVHELKRDYVEVAPNTYVELNVVGKGEKEGTPVWILGECKSQLKKRDVDDFLKNVSKVKGHFSGEKVMVAITYQTSPMVKRYAEELGIRLYYSYELRIRVF